MKVFVGWAYSEDWIEEFVIPIIESYDIKVVTGKELEGQPLTSGVQGRIADCDAGIFFTTRRENTAGDKWSTSDWVIDEIKHAHSLNKTVIEIREIGVDYSNKINEPREYIKLDPNNRLKAVSKLALTLSRLRRLSFKIRLTPEAFIASLRQSLLLPNGYDCRYLIRQGGIIIFKSPKTEIGSEGPELYIYAHDLDADWLTEPDTFIEVTVTTQQEQWVSSGIRLSALQAEMTNFSQAR